MVFLAISILGPAVAERTAAPERDAAAYARVYVKPALTFPGYPLLTMDLVRNALSPWLHLSKRNFLAASVFHLVVLLLAVYLAGRLTGKESSGFWAALLLSATPFVLTVSRVYDVHLPRLTAIALVLAAAADFQKRKTPGAIIRLLGAWLLGVLLCSSTSNYLFFNLAVAGPLAVTLLPGLLAAEHRRSSLIAAGCLAVALAAVTPFLMTYHSFMDPVLAQAPKLDVSLSFWNNPNAVWRQPAATVAYPVALFQALLSPPLAVVVVLGFLLMFFRPGPARRLWAAGVIVPLILLILMPKRNIYYAANLLPALCLGAAAGWEWALHKVHRLAPAVFCLPFVVLSLAYANQLLMPGRLDDAWMTYFVPGRRQYLPRVDSLSLEPFGSVVGNEDLTARRLDQLSATAPRPLAIGFLGRPCRRNVTALELAYRGIFARDIVCRPPLGPEAAAYDAVIVMEELASLDTAREAKSLLDLFRLAATLPDTDAPLVSAAPVNPQRQAMFSQAEPTVQALAERYTRMIRLDSMLFFIAPENEALAAALTKGGEAPPAMQNIAPGYRQPDATPAATPEVAPGFKP